MTPSALKSTKPFRLHNSKSEGGAKKRGRCGSFDGVQGVKNGGRDRGTVREYRSEYGNNTPVLAFNRPTGGLLKSLVEREGMNKKMNLNMNQEPPSDELNIQHFIPTKPLTQKSGKRWKSMKRKICPNLNHLKHLFHRQVRKPRYLLWSDHHQD